MVWVQFERFFLFLLVLLVLLSLATWLYSRLWLLIRLLLVHLNRIRPIKRLPWRLLNRMMNDMHILLPLAHMLSLHLQQRRVQISRLSRRPLLLRICIQQYPQRRLLRKLINPYRLSRNVPQQPQNNIVYELSVNLPHSYLITIECNPRFLHRLPIPQHPRLFPQLFCIPVVPRDILPGSVKDLSEHALDDLLEGFGEDQGGLAVLGLAEVGHVLLVVVLEGL